MLLVNYSVLDYLISVFFVFLPSLVFDRFGVMSFLLYSFAGASFSKYIELDFLKETALLAFFFFSGFFASNKDTNFFKLTLFPFRFLFGFLFGLLAGFVIQNPLLGLVIGLLVGSSSFSSKNPDSPLFTVVVFLLACKPPLAFLVLVPYFLTGVYRDLFSFFSLLVFLLFGETAAIAFPIGVLIGARFPSMQRTAEMFAVFSIFLFSGGFLPLDVLFVFPVILSFVSVVVTYVFLGSILSFPLDKWENFVGEVVPNEGAVLASVLLGFGNIAVAAYVFLQLLAHFVRVERPGRVFNPFDVPVSLKRKVYGVYYAMLRVKDDFLFIFPALLVLAVFYSWTLGNFLILSLSLFFVTFFGLSKYFAIFEEYTLCLRHFISPLLPPQRTKTSLYTGYFFLLSSLFFMLSSVMMKNYLPFVFAALSFTIGISLLLSVYRSVLKYSAYAYW